MVFFAVLVVVAVVIAENHIIMYIRIALGFVANVFTSKWCRLRYASYTTHNVDSIPEFYTAR